MKDITSYFKTKSSAPAKKEQPPAQTSQSKPEAAAAPMKKSEAAAPKAGDKRDRATAVESRKPPAKTKASAKSKAPTMPKKRVTKYDIDDDEGEYHEEDEKDNDFKPAEKSSEDEAYSSEEDEAPPAKKKAVKKAPAKRKEAPKSEEKVLKEEKPKETKAEPAKKANFWQAKNREGPKALGSRPPPVGEENCLGGMTFVLSGMLETLTEQQTKDIIMRYGGRVTGSVSGKTTFLLRGRDAGAGKTEKASKLGTKIIDEDAFYDLVQKSKAKPDETPVPPPPSPPPSASASSSSLDKGKGKASTTETPGIPEEQLWTEKYKPTAIKDIAGNKTLVKNISIWLERWQDSLRQDFETDKNDGADGITGYRALLLSGPPGVGKTTTAHVVARTHGYEPLEFNASDARSKKVLESSITEMMDNRTMTEFFRGDRGTAGKEKITIPNKGKVVLIMDEVDGMSGGDRGGSAELAKLIRKTKIPVICICNDVKSPKVQPILRVCYDARFRRTPVNQLKSRIMTIAYREKLELKPNVVDQLVESTRNDLRQIINILAVYKLRNNQMTFDEARKEGARNQKYSQMGLFDITPTLFGPKNWLQMDLNELINVYFHEYSLANLMVFENYLKVDPERARAMSKTGSPIEHDANRLQLIAEAADAMADGDIVDAHIHGSVQQWSLMPIHSAFSCVRPAYFMKGFSNTRHNFPSWLGQNSSMQKSIRAVNDIRNHVRTKACVDRAEIRQDYIPTFTYRIFEALKKDDLDEVVNIMHEYYFDRETLESISDLSLTAKKPWSLVPAKTKTALMKKYSSTAHPVLFSTGGPVIKKATAVPAEDMEGDIFEDDNFGNDVSEAEDDDDNISEDKLVKESKKRRGGAASSASSSRATKKQKKK